MGRREEIERLLQRAESPLDDDDIANHLGINRHYVNKVCNALAQLGLTKRSQGPSGKLVNRWAAGPPRTKAEDPAGLLAPARRPARPKQRELARLNVDSLTDGFSEFVRQFEHSAAFPGPSLYFHERALMRRRLHSTPAALMKDRSFFEYVYAVLPAWGMHRMGNQRAKVGPFSEVVASFRAAESAIRDLWDLHLTQLTESDAEQVAQRVWDVLASLKISTSATRIVAGSKALHHVLPDLVPPIDRQYTFRFFTGQKAVNRGDERAFLDWFPYFAEIGRRNEGAIEAALARGGFMATGPAKVIDNAIIGFMQITDGELQAGEE